MPNKVARSFSPAATQVHAGSLARRAIDLEFKQILESKVIAGLDALRALAVCMVLSDHLLITDHLFGVHPATGALGVTIFFVLSGFLITAGMLRTYRRTGDIALREFYSRRAFRIFPTFYCCWILTTIVFRLAHRIQWKSAAFSFFYMTDYLRALNPVWEQPWMHMVVSWSLAVEEKFYLLWPLLLLFLLKRQHLKKQNMVRFLLAIILGQWTYRAILYLAFHVRPTYIYIAPDTRMDSLLIGCLVAILVEDDALRLRCSWLLRWQVPSVIAPAALLWMAYAPAQSHFARLLDWSAEPVLAAIMLLQFAYWGDRSWRVCRSGAVRMAARLSYALYLYHSLAGTIVKMLNCGHIGFSTLALTLAMAFASFYLVERPFLRLRDRRRLSPGLQGLGAAQAELA